MTSCSVELDHPQGHYFYPGESISGRVKLGGIEQVQLDLVGKQFCRLERVNTGIPIIKRVERTFLHLSRTIESSDLIREHETIPFEFILPEKLVPGACIHEVNTNAVRKEHLQIPPSLGNPSDKAFLTALDMAPDMARIQYTITMTQIRFDHVEKELVNVPVTRPVTILVIPRKVEPPPALCEGLSDDFNFEDSRAHKKRGFLASTVGQLCISASPPRSVQLHRPQFPAFSPDGALEPLISTEDSPSTALFLTLRFTPTSSHTDPPELQKLSTRLRAVTFWSATPQTSMPSRANTLSNPNLDSYTETLQLPVRSLEGAVWQPDSANAGETSFVAHVHAPVVLPENKVFVPSFQSCLISRVYILECTVKLGGSNQKTSALSVKVPLHMHSDIGKPPAYVGEL